MTLALKNTQPMVNARPLLLLFIGAATGKEILVNFPDRGPDYPIGTITLTQHKGTPLTITTNLQRLENSATGNTWHGKRHHNPP